MTDVLAHHLQPVEAGRAYDDRRTVLIIMKHRNLHAPAQFALDDEAFRSLDVLEIDGAEGGLEGGDDLHQLERIALLNLDVEDVDAREFLEQHRLAFHDGLGGQRADGPQPKHRGAVRDDADQVAARGEAKDIERIFDDGLACRGHARRIRQRQIALVEQLLGGRDRQLPRGRELVIIQRRLLAGFLDVIALHEPLPCCKRRSMQK